MQSIVRTRFDRRYSPDACTPGIKVYEKDRSFLSPVIKIQWQKFFHPGNRGMESVQEKHYYTF